MKVIVIEQIGFGGSITEVYKYSKKRLFEMVKDEYERAKEYSSVENEDEVEEWLEEAKNGNYGDVSIIESDYGVHYNICKVKGA